MAQALLTERAREIRARMHLEAIVLGDWSYEVGDAGINPAEPSVPLPIDPSLQTLGNTVGSGLLGRVVDSGAGAQLDLVGGQVQVAGTGLTASTITKVLSLSGSADPLINGSWGIAGYEDPNVLIIANPLVTDPDVGPLNWELREASFSKPNERASSFHVRIPAGTLTGEQISEVGIFCRVLRAAPVALALVGQTLLYARTNIPAQAIGARTVFSHHVVVQE